MNGFWEHFFIGFAIVSTFFIVSALATPLIGGIMAIAVANTLLQK